MKTEKEKREAAHWRETFALWSGILGGPILWSLQFGINYALAAHVSRTGKASAVHLISLCFFVLALGFVFLSLQNIRRADPNDPDEIVPPRIRFMGKLGLWTSLLFALVILAQAIPQFIIRPGSD